jgi:hypothetical protein
MLRRSRTILIKDQRNSLIVESNTIQETRESSLLQEDQVYTVFLRYAETIQIRAIRDKLSAFIDTVITRAKIPEGHVRLRYTYFDTKNYQRSEKPQRLCPPLTRYIPYYYNTSWRVWNKSSCFSMPAGRRIFSLGTVDCYAKDLDGVGQY